MENITAIILTYNEELHISRSIQNLKSFSKEIFLIDSFSIDETCFIAQNLGAKVFYNKWPGNQAAQFNWALNNLPIETDWVLRLDADEYLTLELIEEIKQKLKGIPEDVTGVVFKRRHIFLDKWIKRGTYPIKLLRLFRYRKAVCEQRWMDEHIQLLEGKTVEFENDFVDHNLNNLSWWTQKHVGYAIREAVDLLDIEFNILGSVGNNEILLLSTQAAEKRRKKLKYAKQPLFWRSFAYFIYRYFFKLGVLEGREGFLWHLLQGLWYRTLVDAKIFEIKKACGSDTEEIKKYIFTNYQIKL